MNNFKLIDLPKILDERGNLSFVEFPKHIPFELKRVYWIYDVPGGEKRGGHAYKKLHEVIIAISGSFDITLDNGSEVQKISLNRSYQGVYVPNNMWRSLDNFSTNSLCLILASDSFCESDYIRDYMEFKKYLLVK
jgi:oxalate decarboxylase/phosphoglucose isomerase-like protein (cupin superfamily)